MWPMSVGLTLCVYETIRMMLGFTQLSIYHEGKQVEKYTTEVPTGGAYM